MIQFSIIENGTIKETFDTIEELIEGYEQPNSIHKEVIKYLNVKCSTKFRHTSKATQRTINARTKEGYTLEDFKKVIDTKSTEWLETYMEIYLRPETLFGTKFESYLNQKGITRNGKFRTNEFSSFITEKKSRELTEEERATASELL